MLVKCKENAEPIPAELEAELDECISLSPDDVGVAPVECSFGPQPLVIASHVVAELYRCRSHSWSLVTVLACSLLSLRHKLSQNSIVSRHLHIGGLSETHASMSLAFRWDQVLILGVFLEECNSGRNANL